MMQVRIIAEGVEIMEAGEGCTWRSFHQLAWSSCDIFQKVFLLFSIFLMEYGQQCKPVKDNVYDILGYKDLETRMFGTKYNQNNAFVHIMCSFCENTSANQVKRKAHLIIISV